MLNVSHMFRKELYEDKRDYIVQADVTLADSTALPLDDPDIIEGGLSVDDAVSSDNNFDIGAAIVNRCTLTLNNMYDGFSEYDFTDARVVPYVGLGLPDGTVERVRKGTFTVDDAKYNGSIIALTCLDNMARFDRPYSLSSLVYPATLGAIVRDACSVCGVELQTQEFPHDDHVVRERPNDGATTFREVISWAAQIACCFCRCDVYGRLELKWYDQQALEDADLDGGSFKPWTTGDIVDGGSFSPWTGGTVYDGGTFGDRDGIHHIYSNFSVDIAVDDVVITGVRVLEKAMGDDGDAIVTYDAGTAGYVISIEGNDLIQDGAGQQIAGWVGAQLIGFRFRRASMSHLSDPTMEAGDVGYLSDRKGNTYRIIISSTRFRIGAAQSTSSSAQTPARNSATRFSADTKNYVENRKLIERERTDREKALEALKQRVDESPGLFTTEELRPDGGSVFYLHNKPLLEDSMVIWIMTTDAWGVSTDGGKTLNAGMTVDGDLIARILTVIGVRGEWFNAGAISIQDEKGKETFYADADTGAVRIVAESFALTSGDTIKSIADTAAGEAVDGQTQTDILNKLTNDGEDKGVYLQDGKLYISFNAARGGTLTLGGVDNVNGEAEILDASGNVVGSFNKEGIFLKKTDVGNSDFSASVSEFTANVNAIQTKRYGLVIESKDKRTSGTTLDPLINSAIKISPPAHTASGGYKNLIGFVQQIGQDFQISNFYTQDSSISSMVELHNESDTSYDHAQIGVKQFGGGGRFSGVRCTKERVTVSVGGKAIGYFADDGLYVNDKKVG